MTPQIAWPEILLRLGLTVIAGFVVGLNRGEHGQAAGLRTTLLVCLAASISMIQVNLLLGMNGRAGNSFVMLDLMRLPLGILSGMGFIGAGAILRKGNVVRGVTTAATLWFVTAMGLCFGGGQFLLGILALALAIFVLSVLKAVERRVPRYRSGTLAMELRTGSPNLDDLSRMLEAAGFRIVSLRVSHSSEPQTQNLRFTVDSHRSADDWHPPPLIAELANSPGVQKIVWTG